MYHIAYWPLPSREHRLAPTAALPKGETIDTTAGVKTSTTIAASHVGARRPSMCCFASEEPFSPDGMPCVVLWRCPSLQRLGMDWPVNCPAGFEPQTSRI